MYINVLQQTSLYGLVAVGMYLSFRVLDFPDLTVDGSFTMGASVFAVGVMSNWEPFLCTLAAGIAGALAGCVTAILHTKGEINKIVAGLLMMIMLYSVNLLIMGGSNIGLLNIHTVADYANTEFLSPSVAGLIVFGALLLIGKLLLDAFLLTEKGTMMRALGDNEQFSVSLGANTDTLKILGLGIANGFVGVSGALVAQNQGFADVNMGFGVIVIGFASLVIGEALLSPQSVALYTTAAVVGSLVYFTIITVALELGLDPNLLKLTNGLLIVLVLYASNNRYF